MTLKLLYLEDDMNLLLPKHEVKLLGREYDVKLLRPGQDVKLPNGPWERGTLLGGPEDVKPKRAWTDSGSFVGWGWASSA